MAKKKLNHHLYEDEKSGVWYFQKKVRGIQKPYKFSLGTTLVGEARKKRDEYLRQVELNGYIPKVEPQNIDDSILFGEIAQKWAKIEKSNLAETSFFNYAKVMNKHILPKFGNLPINSINSLEIADFISDLNCANKTKLNILTPFRSVMNFAKEHKFIESNPFDNFKTKIKLEKGVQKRALTLEEINRFLAALNPFWSNLFLFLFFSGLRIAEAAALKWKHVNFSKKTIYVENNLVRVNGGKIIYKKTKCDHSKRAIKVSDSVLERLRDQYDLTWKGHADNYVFVNKKGRPIHRHTLNNSIIIPTLKKAGIETHISIKDTRASYVTNSLDIGERVSFIRKQAGHKTNQMIIDYYYRDTPAPTDVMQLEKAWNSTSIPPDHHDR
jgi:integrase